MARNISPSPSFIYRYLLQTSLLSLTALAFSCGQPESPGSPSGGNEAPGPVPGGAFPVQALLSGETETAALAIKEHTEGEFQALKEERAVPDGATLRTPNVGRASLNLLNDRLLALNTDTEVGLRLYQNTLTLHRGELFLETPPGAGEALTVEAGQNKVHMQAAALDIRQQADVVEVSVLRGQATLAGPNGSLTLTSAEKGVIGADGIPHRAPPGDLALLTDWTLSLRKSIEAGISPTSSPASEEESLLPPPGFGTLFAKTPGQQRERPFAMLSQDIRVTITDQVARTEVEQVFENPTGAVVEGSFRFTLPEGASVTRYAMYVRDQLMEGELVEREEGRKILKEVIDEFLEEQARLRDPALVEWTSGNTFQTRIFPILPHEKKRIILAYTQVLPTQDGVTRYTYPFAAQGNRADRIGELRFTAKVASSAGMPEVEAPLYPVKREEKDGALEVSFSTKDFQPPADMVLDIFSPRQEPARLATAAREGEAPYFLLSLRPTLPQDAAKAESVAGRDWLFLVDTSQSRTPGEMLVQRGLVGAFLKNLDYEDRARVFAYDYQLRELTEGFTGAEGTNAALTRLGAIPPAGATNLLGALSGVAKLCEPGRRTHVLVVGDLSPTVGELRPGVLAEQAKVLFKDCDARVSTVGVGASVDELMLEALPRALGGTSYRMSTGEDVARAALRIIASQMRPVLSEATISIEGVETSLVYPETLSTIPEGREILLVGRYRGEGEATITLRGRVGGKNFEQKYQAKLSGGAKGNQFVISQWALSRLGALTAIGDEAARKEAIALSKSAGVMSRYTSFIVLESEAMYKEFGVERASKDREQWTGEEKVAYESIDPESDGDAPGEARDESQVAAPRTEPSVKPTLAKKKSRAPSAAANGKMMDFGDDFGGGGGGYYPYPRAVCRTHRSVSFRIDPPKVTKADEKQIEDLKKKIADEPLVRVHRQKLLAKLMGLGRTQEALSEALAWYALDSANPALLRALSELYRLEGKVGESVRMLSGVLDISPENAEVIDLLARYAAARERLEDVYALRLARALRLPADAGAQVDLAEAAAALGRTEEVISILGAFVEVSASGKVTVKGKMSASVKTRALKRYSEALAKKSSPAAPPAPEAKQESTRANLAIELTWEGDAALEMWVLGPRNQIFFGQGKGAQSLILEKARMGRYRVQVSDASLAPVGDIKGKLTITGFKGSGSERKKTIPFTIPAGGGLELGSVGISVKEICKWAY